MESGIELKEEPGGISETERRRLLWEWNQTAVEYPHSKCVHELFEAQAQRRSEAVALVCGERQLTYRELNEQADRLAAELRALGAGPDVLVGVCLERSLEMVVALYAIHKAGSAYLPMDPGYPRERLAFMLEDAQAPVLVTQ
jgi:non-ribosomal peptide synthetase component F